MATTDITLAQARKARAAKAGQVVKAEAIRAAVVKAEASMTARRNGGYRGTTEVARFTAQLVGMVEPRHKELIVSLARKYGISQGKVVRAVIARGLPVLEDELLGGETVAGSLV